MVDETVVPAQPHTQGNHIHIYYLEEDCYLRYYSLMDTVKALRNDSS